MKKNVNKILAIIIAVGMALSAVSSALAAGARGDVDGNSKINSNDALKVLQYSVGSSPTNFDKSVADMNSDGKINSVDALEILKICVGFADTTPSTVEEIVNYYNTATAKVVSSKAGYSKTRITDNEQIDGNSIVKSFKTLIYKFMGIGADNKYTENVTKGNWGDRAYFLASKLTASDVTSASCTNSNGVYTITMKLKGGSSSANKDNPSTAANSSLDKSGICVGTEDKVYLDHKTASVIYDAIQGTYAGVEISESYSNATLKATVNSSTGQMTGLTVEWNCSVTISNLLGATASATGISHVTYSNFKF